MNEFKCCHSSDSCNNKRGTPVGGLLIATTLELEAVKLQLFLLGKPRSGDELRDVVALISLELNDLTVLLMLYYCTIAGKFLFTSLDYFLLVVVIRNTLNSCQSLTTISLLYSDMDNSFLSSVVFTLACICKWVKSLKILDVRHKSYNERLFKIEIQLLWLQMDKISCDYDWIVKSGLDGRIRNDDVCSQRS